MLFQTGYGPSGLSHIGTFAEVARTTMIRRAFARLAPQIPTRLFCFSDDMDGLRKVPDNIPNKELIAPRITRIATISLQRQQLFKCLGNVRRKSAPTNS
jgi:lysyl-tRNA synthetase class 1